MVKRRSWNELKTEVLSLLKDNPGTTSKDISAALEVSMSNAGMILHRFARARARNEKSSWWKEAEEKMIAQFCLFTSKI